MYRFAISLALVLTLMGGLYAPDADACGVKLAIKTVRQKQRARQAAPIASGDRAVVATREARRPVATGPTMSPSARRVVVGRADPAATIPSPASPVRPAAAPIAAKPQPSAVATATPKVATATPKVATVTPKPETATPAKVTTVPPKTDPKQPEATEKVATVTKQEASPSKAEKIATATNAEPATRKPAPATSATIDRELYFAMSSSALRDKASLDQAARWLAANPGVNATIAGHADPTGNPDANLTLSQARAEAVRDYLVKKGIATSRLEVMAFGDTQLKYDRADARNRHVTIEAKK